MPRFGSPYVLPLPFCGCWYIIPTAPYQRQYLPQIELESATTILSHTSRTRLIQTFSNNHNSAIPEAGYTFPLYDGVSVVSFTCTIGDRKIVGVVKEKQQARTDYENAVSRGETAGLLEQLPEAGDVFTTKIGNIPVGGTVSVEIIYLGELKHDTETDGARFTIPTVIAPRYGSVSNDSAGQSTGTSNAVNTRGIKISVDITVEEGSSIRGVQSSSHPIAVTLGRNAHHDEDVFQNNLASATLSLSGTTELDKDFVIVVKAQNQDTPVALLESHDSLENQRAMMMTLVPKFNLPNSHPELVFVIDRSGSMGGKMPIVIQALKIFLKSLPTSAKFNICSFGTSHTFLFSQSKPYDQSSLKEALAHADTLDANYGGTEILKPVQQCIKQRLGKTPLEIIMLTDGEVWNQDEVFKVINEATKDRVRVFSLGIGSGASSSLVEGMARAGNGFAQFVSDGEQIDKRVVRMLKAALTPFVSDYSLEVVYEAESASDKDDDFEIIESFTESMKSVVGTIDNEKLPRKVISLFTSAFKEESATSKAAGRYDHLPPIAKPKILQAPHQIPQLYSFSRTTIYLLFGPDSCQRQPQRVVLRGTTEHGALILEIPVQYVGSGQTIHQMAAKKAIQDLEEGRGWLTEVKTNKDKFLKAQCEGDWERIIERETVRLGIEFQVAGKYCSFVAVESHVGDQDTTMSGTTSPSEHIMLFGSMDPRADSSRNADEKRKSNPVIGKKQKMFARNVKSSSTASSVAPPPYQALQMLSTHRAPAPAMRYQSRDTRFAVPSGALPPPPPPSVSGGLFGAVRKRSENIMKRSSSVNFSLDSTDEAGVTHAKPHSYSSQQQGVGPEKELEKLEGSEEAFGAASSSQPGSSPRAHYNSTSRSRVMTVEASGSTESTMHAVIGLQEFDGSWTKIDSLLSTIGISQQDFRAAATSIESDTAKATALAVAWLEKVMAKEKDTWEMVVDKAKAWIVIHGGVQDAGTLIEATQAAFFTL